MNTEPKEHCTNHFSDGSKIFPNRDCCTPPADQSAKPEAEIAELRAALAETVAALEGLSKATAETLRARVAELERELAFAKENSSSYRAFLAIREENNELRAQLTAAKADWQPIATAPKDGTHVLVGIAGLDRSTGEAYHANGAWFTWDSATHTRTVYTTPPTHWLPLPPAPTAARAQEETK